jgi:peptidoglycan/xylan/chitin deacetylase (PgdA/CDA1 family)
LNARRVGAGVAATAAVLGFAGPSVCTIPDVRRIVAPRLAGRGRADHVALTFDDGPDPASTPYVLDALHTIGWRATFFLVGDMLLRAGSLASEIAAAGHEIAVHGQHHRSHLLRAPADVIADVTRATDLVADATGVAPRWMRPPLGHLATASIVAARRNHERVVLWSAWGRDWRAEATADTVVADIARSAHGESGATVLLHDSDMSSAPGSWRTTLAALPRLAERWAAAGLTVGPLCEHGLAA